MPNVAFLEYWICCVWKHLYKRYYQWGICQSLNFVIHCACVNVVAWRVWLFQNPFFFSVFTDFEQIWFCSLFEILRMLNTDLPFYRNFGKKTETSYLIIWPFFIVPCIYQYLTYFQVVFTYSLSTFKLKLLIFLFFFQFIRLNCSFSILIFS